MVVGSIVGHAGRAGLAGIVLGAGVGVVEGAGAAFQRPARGVEPEILALAVLLDGFLLGVAGLVLGALVGLVCGAARLTLPPATMSRILAALEAHSADADVVHLNLPTPAFSILADHLGRRVAAPVVVGYEAHLAPCGELIRTGRLFASLQFYLPRLVVNNRLVARLASHRAARYVVSSRLQVAELAGVGVDSARIALIANVLDAAKLQPCSRSEARRSLGLPDCPLVVYVGHYNHVKGVDVLVTAFARVAAEKPDARLVLAWSGLGRPAPVRTAIARSGVAGHVVQLGKVDVARLLAAADLVALPYRMTIGQAAFPGLVLETMAAGVPLVTTDLPLLREVVEDGKTALLCPPENPPALAGQILRLLTDRDLARRMTVAQANTMWSRFDPARLAVEYEQLSEDVVVEQARILQPARGGRIVRYPAVRRTERRLGPGAGAGAHPPGDATPRKSA